MLGVSIHYAGKIVLLEQLPVQLEPCPVARCAGQIGRVACERRRDAAAPKRKFPCSAASNSSGPGIPKTSSSSGFSAHNLGIPAGSWISISKSAKLVKQTPSVQLLPIILWRV